jgi:hypothetical protein
LTKLEFILSSYSHWNGRISMAPVYTRFKGKVEGR